MNVRNCRRCGNLFNYALGPMICPKCREAMDAKLDKVQTIKIEETFWGRIFHFCTVVVTTAGSDYRFFGIKDGNK